MSGLRGGRSSYSLVNMIMKKIIATVLATAALVSSFGVAHALPYDWQYTYRNSDDTEFVPGIAPSFTTGTYAVLGSNKDTSQSASWYYFPSANCWNITNGGTTYGTGNYQVALDIGCFNVMDLSGTQNIVNSLAATQGYVAAATSSIQSLSTQEAADITLNTQINANLFGTSTTMTAQAASTTNGLMTQTQSDKLDAMAANLPWSWGTTTRSITTSTGSAGFQVSATRNSSDRYNVTVSTTATIGGSSGGYVALEVAPTNSATAGDWVEIGRCGQAQTITLAIALQSVQTVSCQLSADIPAGYYAKLRSVTSSGTPTYTFNSSSEVLK